MARPHSTPTFRMNLRVLGRRSRGLVLGEVLVGLTAWSVILLASGHLLYQAVHAQRAAETRWRVLLGCRTALELTCATELPVDTVFAAGSLSVRARAVVDTLSSGIRRVRSEAWAGDDRYGRRFRLCRAAWPGGAS